MGRLTLWGMVTRKRLRTILNALALYVLAALLIGYFGVNAYSGDRGLKAKEDIDRQMVSLNDDLTRLKLEHAQWARRVALLKSAAIDPDMLDERARLLLDYVEPNDLTLMFRPVTSPAGAPHP
jgi:cell division protein FtsB